MKKNSSLYILSLLNIIIANCNTVCVKKIEKNITQIFSVITTFSTLLDDIFFNNYIHNIR